MPVSVIALSDQELNQRSIRSLTDITTASPGLFSAPGVTRGGDAPIYSIRGILNRDPSLTNDPSIGIYFADVPWARPAGSNAATVDLASVQVLKGPQGTLFGRNSDGGAILITPRAPTDHFEGYAKTSRGNFGLFGLEGVVNIPLGERAAVRLVGQHRERDGYLHAVNSGNAYNDIDNTSFRGSLLWRPTDEIKSTTIVSRYRSSTVGEGVKLVGLAPCPLPSLNNSANCAIPTLGPLGAALQPVLVKALAATNALGKYEFLTSFAPNVPTLRPAGVINPPIVDPFSRVKTLDVQNITEVNLGTQGILGDVTLKNILGYRKIRATNTFEALPIPLLNIEVISVGNTQQLTEEAQLLGRSGALDYVAGIFYSHETGDDGSLSQQFNTNYNSTFGHGVNNSTSVFLHANLDLSSSIVEGLSLTGGFRMNWDRKRFSFAASRQSLAASGPLAGQVIYTCVPSGQVRTSDSCSFPRSTGSSEPTWDVGLSYKPRTGLLLYTSVAHGYRPGGFNSSPSLGVAASTNPFLPEFVNNYEAGLKSDFSLGRMPVRLNISGYYTKYTDIQRTISQVTGGILNNLTINAAKASISGLEAELMIRPTSSLNLSANYAYTRPRYDKFTDSVASGGKIYPIDVSDSEFILASRHSLSAVLNYTLPVAEKLGRPTISVSYYYRSSFFATVDINTARCFAPGDPQGTLYVNCLNRGAKVPGYGLANVRLDWERIGDSAVDVGVFVNNVTDRFYWSNGQSNLSSFGALSATIGAPRMFGVEVTLRFADK